MAIRNRLYPTAGHEVAAQVSDRRKDWAEKISTRLIVTNDLIALEKLNVRGMTKRPVPKPDPDRLGNFLPNRARAKAGLSRGILASCWGMLATRMGQKASASGVTVVQIEPRFTSQQCHVCGHTAAGNRESQAVFRCVSCGHEDHADRNAARNILARGLLLLTTGEIVLAHAPGHGGFTPASACASSSGTHPGSGMTARESRSLQGREDVKSSPRMAWHGMAPGRPGKGAGETVCRGASGRGARSSAGSASAGRAGRGRAGRG